MGAAVVLKKQSVFHAIDWLTFCITGAMMFAAYLFTLAPEVTLRFSGIFSCVAPISNL